jgi:hypothetical protein
MRYLAQPWNWSRLIIITVLLAPPGCSGRPGRIRPPDVDADEAAEAAIDQLDKDGDGQLNAAELQEAAGLAAVKDRYDADGNGLVSLEEVAAGIRRWSEGQVGAAAVAYSVQLDGRPLPGAQVEAVPEPFLRDAIKPAKGLEGYLAVAPEDRPPNSPNMPLIMPGLYRIKITHPSVSVPAKYNTHTTLGLEVSAETRADQAIVWALTTKAEPQGR